MFPDSISLPTAASRAEWLAQRSRGIGGSDVSAILGLNRWSSPLQVWMEKTGRSQEKRKTWPMMRGNALEGPLLDWFSEQTGIGVQRNLRTQVNRADQWMLVNLDGATDDGGIAECKTTNWWMREEWEDGQVADHAELQAQWGMAVTGAPHAWVIVAVSDSDPEWRRVDADDALHVTMYDACRKFWFDHVLADKEPDAVAVDLPELRKRLPEPDSVYLGDEESDHLAREYADAADREKVAKQMRADAQARLLQHLGDVSTLVVDGKVAATRKVIHKDAYTVSYAARDEVRLTVPKNRKDWKRNG